MLYEDVYEISKLLLAEDDAERTPKVLLRRLVERCGAETETSRRPRGLRKGVVDGLGTSLRPLIEE